MKTEVKDTNNEEVARMLDGFEDPRCWACKGPARMPEDCVGVLQTKGENYPLFLCPKEECEDKFLDDIRKRDKR